MHKFYINCTECNGTGFKNCSMNHTVFLQPYFQHTFSTCRAVNKFKPFLYFFLKLGSVVSNQKEYWRDLFSTCSDLFSNPLILIQRYIYMSISVHSNGFKWKPFKRADSSIFLTFNTAKHHFHSRFFILFTY